MELLMEPLVEAGKHGVEMTCGDSYVRVVYPILMSYIADYPEQCLVGCSKQNFCPMCNANDSNRGDLPTEGNSRKLRKVADVVRAIDHRLDGNRKSSYFDEFGLKDVRPFYARLPHVELGTLFTPDLLHQLHRGCFKDHLLEWFQAIMGDPEFNARYQKVTPYPGIRHFHKAISSLSQTTGKEHKEMEKVFAVVIRGAPGVSAEARKAAVALLHFIYLAQLPCQSDRTVKALYVALQQFHKYKHVFIGNAPNGKEMCKGFHRIPKFHSLEHYMHLIQSKGSPDGFNSEAPERLHIEFAKKAYRATNKQEFVIQMVRWLRRRDGMSKQRAYVEWWRKRRKNMNATVHPRTLQCGQDERNEVGKKSIRFLI